MISVFGSSIGKEEIENVTKCLTSQWLGFGKKVEEFEKRFSEKFGRKNFLMVDSGSNALYMAVKLLNLAEGTEIILPSYTWVACANAILMNNCIPVFCDVDLNTMNVDIIDISKQISRKTKAIMIVDYAGLPINITAIRGFGLPIIEDAAHAVCSSLLNFSCGSLADIGIYSFDAIKNLTTGEGGGITIRDDQMYERAKRLRYCGIGKSGFDSIDKKNKWWEYDIQEIFIKMLPTDINASIGLAQLDKIDQLQKRRQWIWETYQKEFKNVEWIKTPVDINFPSKHSYFTYCIKVPKRDVLAHYLLENDIYTTVRYHPLHMNKIYGQTKKKLPNCEILNRTALNIPLHPRLTDADIGKVVDMIKKFGKRL